MVYQIDLVKPKILIAAPIAGVKQYSMGEWLRWVANQTFANYDFALCVNGKDRDLLIEKLEATQISDVHKAIKKPIILEMANSDNTSTIQNLCYAREILMDYARKHDYTHLLFLDTDTIPHHLGTIQMLLDQQKDYVSGLYFYKNSKVPVAINKLTHKNFTLEELKPMVLNKELVETWGVGYGCVLLSRKAFEVPLDYEKFGEQISDDFAHGDSCTKAGITLYFYPLVCCQHLGNGTDAFSMEKVEK